MYAEYLIVSIYARIEAHLQFSELGKKSLLNS